MAPSIQHDVRGAAKDLLLDPGSYQEDGMYARESYSRRRRDGSDTRYYNRVEVEFRTKNTFGGMATGYATVRLTEDPDEGCKVLGAELQ